MRFLFLLILSFVSFIGFSQSCDNSGFEYGNLFSWEAYTGTCCGGGITTPGAIDGRHTVMDDLGFDPYSLDSITILSPSGGDFSVRLGNNNVGSQAERITKSFLVTPENTAFTYQYALMLEDPDGHSPIDKPKFEVRLLDENMDVVPGPCGYYQVTAGPDTDTWIKNSTVRLKDWATVGLDLTPYMGQVMTIDFSVEDCGLGGHFGYAYIDAKCGFLDIIVNGFCSGDNDSVYLTAPVGFDQYYWPETEETTQEILLSYPQVGDSVVVEITNEAGCASRVLHVFEEVTDAVGAIVNGGDICAGENLVLRPDSIDLDWRYNWTSSDSTFGSFDTVAVVSPLKTTEYYLEILNLNGCSNSNARDTILVEVDTALVFDLVDVGPVCFGDSLIVKLGDLIDGEFTWSINDLGGLTENDSVILSPGITTDYFINVDNGVCQWDDGFSYLFHGESALKDTLIEYFCPGDSVTLGVNLTGFVGYRWDGDSSGVDTFDIRFPMDEQIVTLELYAEQGCTDTIIFQLLESSYPYPTISVSSDTVCAGTAAILNGLGAGPDAGFNWRTETDTLTSNSSVIYLNLTSSSWVWVTAYNFNGCFDPTLVDSVFINVNDSVTFELPADTTICLGDNITIDPVGGSGDYRWSNSLFDLTSSETSVTVSPERDVTYYLTVNKGECSFSDYMKVDVYTSLYESNEEEDYCEGDPSISLTGDSGFSSYEWVGYGDNDRLLTIGSPNGSFVAELAMVNTDGCPDTARFNVREIKQPSIFAGNDTTICFGDNLLLNGESDYDDNDYVWTSSPGSFYSTNPNSYVSPNVTTRYTLSYTNNINCTLADPTSSILVNVDSSTDVDLGEDREICEGEYITLSSSTGTGDYNWSVSPLTLIDKDAEELTFSPRFSSTVTLEISNEFCTGQDIVNVIVNDTVESLFDVNVVSRCEGQSYVFIPEYESGWSDYIWRLPSGEFETGTTLIQAPVLDGTYWLTIRDENNCLSMDSVAVELIDLPNANLGPDKVICQGEVAILAPIGYADSYEWSSGETTRVISVRDQDVYSLNTSNGSCESSDEVMVTVMPNPVVEEFPNVFTPNGDGYNDYFELPISMVETFSIKIYNRWGKLVFKSEDYNEFWNGKNGRIKSPSGVYFYKVKFESTCTEGEIVKSGYVELIRAR